MLINKRLDMLNYVSSNVGLGQLATGILSLSTQRKIGTSFEGSDFYMLCPRYSGLLTPMRNL